MDNFLFLPRALTAALYDIAFAVTFGLVLVDRWLSVEEEEHLRRELLLAAVLGASGLLLALVVQCWTTTATVIGSSDIPSVSGQFTSVLTGTHAGRVLLSECLLAILLAAWLTFRYAQSACLGTWNSLGLLFLMAATRAATGHPAAEGDFTLPEFAQLVHLVSISTWAGCVIAAGLVVLPALVRDRPIESMTRFLRKLSRAVAFALLLVVLSGIYNSCRGLGGTVTPLLGTQWGRLLDLKLALVSIAAALGLLNRRMVHSSRDLSVNNVARLMMMMRAEAILMLLILAVSAFLANSPPTNLSTTSCRPGLPTPSLPS